MSLDVSKMHNVSRDYVSIYRNLQEIVPELTTQWSIEDESDPGVVLVKLMSMIGDMLSYNTDKAYLEAFPDTVTQRKNAYQIFKLIGYKMHWFRSAECECYFNNPATNQKDIIYIPRYSTIMSNDGTICYTNPTEDLNITLGIDGESDPRQQTTLIEGVPITPDIFADSVATFGDNNTYIFNGNTAWHSVYKYNVTSDIITDNRIYFNSVNIEEKYITLIDDAGVTWSMVDNIDTAENINERIFEFDVDEFNRPYIKLIDYWQDLNISKFKLFYILSSGNSGVVSEGILTNVSGDAYMLLNGANAYLEVFNKNSVGGFNPDSPSIARKESAKYINTFDTLVTLDDFTKFMKRYDIVGNAISKDYTNDFNKKVFSDKNDIDSIILEFVNQFDNLNVGFISEITDIDTFLSGMGYMFDLTEKTLTKTDDLMNSTLNAQLLDVFSQYAWIKSAINVWCERAYNTKYTGIALDKLKDNDIASATLDFFILLILSLVDSDSDSEIDATPYIDILVKYYGDTYARSMIRDVLQSDSTTNIVSGDINIYTTLKENVELSEYNEKIDSIEDDIYSSKLMPLNVNPTLNGIDYYKWTVGGVVYLKTPVSYNKAQEILVNIDNALKYIYSVENIGYNNAVRPIDVVNNIMNVDKQIYYVDIDKITYQEYDMYSDNKIGEIFTDKNLITGNKLIANVKYDDVFSSNETGGTHFELNFLDGIEFESSGGGGGDEPTDVNYRDLMVDLVNDSGVPSALIEELEDEEFEDPEAIEDILFQFYDIDADNNITLNSELTQYTPNDMFTEFGEEFDLFLLPVIENYLIAYDTTYNAVKNTPFSDPVAESLLLITYLFMYMSLVSMPGGDSPDEYEMFLPYIEIINNHYVNYFHRNFYNDLTAYKNGGSSSGGGGGSSDTSRVISTKDAKYLSEYSVQDIEQGNILIKPNSFCITFENGDYIVKDNGYGSLVANENILDMSSIEYKITDGHMIVKFDINNNISLDEDSEIVIKFARNNITMALYDGLNPSLFTIDSESVEV